VSVINRVWPWQKAAIRFLLATAMREAAISKLVSFVISRVVGTEVISPDVRVNDFPALVAQFSYARRKARHPDGLNTEEQPLHRVSSRIAKRNAEAYRKMRAAHRASKLLVMWIVVFLLLFFIFNVPISLETDLFLNLCPSPLNILSLSVLLETAVNEL